MSIKEFKTVIIKKPRSPMSYKRTQKLRKIRKIVLEQSEKFNIQAIQRNQTEILRLKNTMLN